MKTLDTNICSYILRHQPQSVVEHFHAQAGESFFLRWWWRSCASVPSSAVRDA